MKSFINNVFYKDSSKMVELPDNSIDCIVTSPPYFNTKNYAKDGHQFVLHSNVKKQDVGGKKEFSKYIASLLIVWKECYRVLKPNGKLCINVPLMPLLKSQENAFHNRYIFDLQSEIQNSLLKNTKFNLMDLFVWNRTNSSKKLMFGSYPYPSNFYAQNTCEFITIYVKPGKPKNNRDINIRKKSMLSKKEWLELTKQVWNLPSPNKGDKAFGIHPAIMPIELASRCIKLYSWVGDVILDPFAGSGTTLLAAKSLKRNFVGYEIYKHYQKIINKKVYESK